MSFPFGGFKTPEKSRKGRYSGAERNFIAEMKHDEGDSDKYKENIDLVNDPNLQTKWEEEWNSEIMEKKDLFKDLNLRIWALGQSHMDIAWLWRIYQIVNKARITHGKAAWHVLNIPDFSFTFSQPVMLDWLKKEDPETFELVKKAVSTGRFELQGGTYVESDGKIPSGEAWCRTRLYGQRWYLENFNTLAEIEWLPDSFGYNNNIPQFVTKSGGKYFYTQKITGNFPPDEFPFAHFVWKSLCGSEVICYSNNHAFRALIRWHLFGHTRYILKKGSKLECNYFSDDPKSLLQLGEMYPDVCLVYGVGDGGHGPNSYEINQMRYYIKKGYIQGLITARDYFHKYDAIKDRLPIWKDAELFYNLHRGTLTTQGLVKKMNRYFEWTLTGLETLSTFVHFAYCSTTDSKDDDLSIHDAFQSMWKDILLLQFHDILPGSSIPEVYDDCYDIWIELKQKIRTIKDNLFKKIIPLIPPSSNIKSKPDHIITIINPNSFSGKSFIEINIDFIPDLQKIKYSKTIAITDSTGEIHLGQFYSGSSYREPILNSTPSIIYCDRVSAWSAKTVILTLLNQHIADQTINYLNETDVAFIFNSETSKIVISKDSGLITEYYDKRIKKQIFSNPSNKFQVFRDWSPFDPAWNIGAGYRKLPFSEEEHEIELKSIELTEKGPVRWCIEVTHLIPESNTLCVQKIYLYAELPGIFFEVYLDWKQEDAIAKNYFSFNTNSIHAISEGPFTSEIYTCDPDKRSHLEKQRWESCCHNWVALPSPDNIWGISIINNCKYGFDIIKDTLGITLVRGPMYPEASPNSYAVVERKSRKDGGPPTHTDQEEHVMQFAIIPYDGPWNDAEFQKLSHYYNRRPISRIISGENVHIEDFNIIPISIEPKNLEIVSMKLPENKEERNSSIIIRTVEHGRKQVKGRVKISENLNIKSVTLVDLLEEKMECNQIMDLDKIGDNVISFDCIWNPHEIHTFKLTK